MNPDRWQQVKKIFDTALKLAPGERVRFLDENCSDDKILRQEVEKLLDSFADDSFMEQPAAREVASVIIEAETKHLEAGKCFGHYQVIRQIGAGGMGEVYLARDKKLDRLVAVKILNENFAQHESNLRRFTQEAKAASALNHPNILVIHEIGESEEANYIVSEFVEGKTLREHFKQSSVKLSEILDISIQITNALSAAHTAHIVHRDIKPENIMVRSDGYAKILDFGLAKLVEQKVIGLEDATVKQNQTARGVILGTVNYMSPEQAKGERVDERTDIFSFGVLVYEMIAGRTPFAGDSMSETFANLINSEPQPLSRYAANVPTELQRIVSKMLKKNKDERYQTAKDLLIDLKSLQKRLEFEAELDRDGEKGRSGEKENAAKTQPSPLLTVSSYPLLNSVAVLPFSTLSLEADDEYLGLGLADALITQLSRTRQLAVRPTSAVRHHTNSNQNSATIGRELRVGSVLEGNLQRAGERLRVTVQLVNVETETPLWAEKFDVRWTDIFDVQDEIASQVASALLQTMSSGEHKELTRRGTNNVEAYQLYLKARFHLAKSDPLSLQKAISLFQQTVALAPDYAEAHAGLAEAYLFSSYLGGEPQEVLPKAREAAQKAIRLDASSAEARVSLGVVKWNHEWNWRDAESEYKRAIELNPNYSMAYAHYGMLLANMRRLDEAFTLFKKGLQIDPLSSRLNAYLGLVHIFADEPEKAIEQCEKTLELDSQYLPAHGFLSQAYWMKGDFRAAVEAARRQCEIQRAPIALSNLAHAYASNGQIDEARKILAELEAESATQKIPPLYFAVIHLGLGETEQVWNRLEQAFEQHSFLFPGWLNGEPRFQVLRHDPRFQDLLRRVGLPTDANADGKPTDETKQETLQVKAITDLTAQSQTGKSSAAGIIENRKHSFIIGLIILLLMAGGFGYYFLSAKKMSSGAGGKKTLAVLPFINASQDANAEYLSDGITESVINNLSQFAGLKVMSRNSAFRFKDNQTDTKNIASQLGVETLVTGDIKQLGDKLVINVRLIDASDDSQIWGNQYVKTSADIIAAQNEIAQAVAQNLRLKLTNPEEKQLGKNYTENVEAYQLYLRGRYHYYKSTQPGIRKSIDFYQQAIQIDPNYALAYAGMADAYRTLPLAGLNVASKEALPPAKAFAKRALEIDADLAEAHIALGWVGFLYDWDWQASETEFKRAIEISPNNSDARRGYAHLLSNTGRHEEAIAEVKRARELDPLTLITNALEGQFLFYAGRDDEAIARFNKTLEIEPNYWIAHNGLGRVYIRQGRYAEAIAVLTKAREFSGGSTEPITQLGYALAKSGNREQAQATLAELKSLAAVNFVPASNFAMIYNGLSEKDEALNYLEKSFQEREVQISFVKIDPRWDEFRTNPRFVEIIKRMNLE